MKSRCYRITFIALTVCLLTVGRERCAASAVSEIADNDTVTAQVFKPNPKSAYLMAMIFPGVGQAYNRQYWKLPIVYGGLVCFMYAITWNNKNYSDYRDAYFDLVLDNQADPTGEHPENWSQSWQDFVPANVNPANYFRNSNFQTNLKSGKDFYRRNRDLSIILSIAFYFICVADAYVDAQMYDFDVTPDLSMRITPDITPAPKGLGGGKVYALNFSFTF